MASSLVLLLLLVGAAAGGAALWGTDAARAPGPLTEPRSVVIERGLRTHEIAELLERRGVISDEWLFLVAAHLTRAMHGNLKAGEYEFPPGASMTEVLAIMRSGRAVVHKLTIPEGWTIAQVVESVNAHPALTGTLTDIPPEGGVLPDTYVFHRGLERDELIARMRQAQEEILDDLWQQRAPDLPIRTRQEALILASIVEKETAVAEERRQVAAVFLNRLRKNMRLQSDPTIIYGITGGLGRLDRPILRSDIDKPTPYNTYRINGLPPTPIANAGREAIAAVLQPEATDHLYFVADGTGGHAFAKTYQEHQENVRRWREIERADRQELEPNGEAPVPVAAEVEDPGGTEAEPAPLLSIDAAEAEPSLPGDAEPDTTPDAKLEAAAVSQPEPAIAAVVVREPPSSPGETEASDNSSLDSQPTVLPEAEPQPVQATARIAATRIPLPRPKPRRD